MSFEEWCVSKARVGGRRHRRITLDDKMATFQQLATLVASGTPILQSIQVSAQQTQSTRLEEVLDDVQSCVASGSPLHAALAQHETVFEPHWVGVIQTGEMTGRLGAVLLDLNQQISEQRETRRKLTGAMIYPLTLVVVAVAAVAVMLWLVVPTFATMFRDMGSELPGITQFVVDVSDWIVAYGVYVLAGLGLLGYFFRRCLRNDTSRRRLESIVLICPLLGELAVQAAMYRFASNIALLLKSGVPLLDALGTLRSVFQTRPVYREALESIQRRVAAGRTLAESLEATGLFTSMLINMVRTAEESGMLVEVMEQIAPYYKEKVETLIAKVTKLMEPAIIVVMGGMIATVMMSIYMPMFEMAGKIH
jgi:type IV pilus assembly protein PilC